MRHLPAVVLLALPAGTCSAAEEAVTIPTRSGVTLSYLLDQDKAAARDGCHGSPYSGAELLRCRRIRSRSR